jgi:hypothetical protein
MLLVSMDATSGSSNSEGSSGSRLYAWPGALRCVLNFVAREETLRIGNPRQHDTLGGCNQGQTSMMVESSRARMMHPPRQIRASSPIFMSQPRSLEAAVSTEKPCA